MISTLTARANSELKQAWETGSAVEIQTAMAGFIAKYWKDLLKHAPYVPTQTVEFRTWLKQFAQWLFSTDHLTVRYEIAYEGVDIRKLSPGTRGIVLLLLYLALDDADDRPLIIDQPEENLDPKSVFDELVSLFITAKTKRQVIMVTHNANLVITRTQIRSSLPMRARTRPEVYLQLPMLLVAWKTPIFAKRCAISSRVARMHSANVRGAFGCGSSDSGRRATLSLEFGVYRAPRKSF